MNTKKYDVFISYRRRNLSSVIANSLHDYLVRSYDCLNISLDTNSQDNFGAGDWLKTILRRIETCNILYLVVTSETFEDNNSIYEDSKYQIFTKENDLDVLYAYIDNNPNVYTEYDVLKIEIIRGLKRFREGKLDFVPIIPEDKNGVMIPQEFTALNSIVYKTISDEFWTRHLGDKSAAFAIPLLNLNEDKWHTQYAKRGQDITAKELYYDAKRTEYVNGFHENFYKPRERVDGTLNELFLRNDKAFVFVTGLPGSGKSRAIYELCKRGALRERSVIILNTKNIVEIAEKIKKRETKKSSNRTNNTTLCFVCDQIVEVFNSTDKKELLCTFLELIRDSNNQYRLLASNTEARLKDFIQDDKYADVFESTQTKYIYIPQNLDETLIAQLQKHFRSENKTGQTVADFIPGLIKYASGIISNVEKSVNPSYFHAWLQALQLVAIFRREQRLFLAILVMMQIKKIEERDDLLNCIRRMIDENMLIIRQKDGRCVDSRIITSNWINLNTRLKIEYDGEEFPKVLDKDYIFELNEIVWQYLQKSETQILFDFASESDLEPAIETWYQAFGEKCQLSSLIRIIPRIPRTSSKELDKKLQSTANEIVLSILDSDIDHADKSNFYNLQTVYSLIIGRAKSEEEINKILNSESLQKYGIVANPLHGYMVGELYRFAEYEYGTDQTKLGTYVEKIREKRSYLIISGDKWFLNKGNEDWEWTLDDLYAIRKELENLYHIKKIKKDFHNLKNYIWECFKHLGIGSITLNDKIRQPLDYLCAKLLANWSDAQKENVQEIYRLLKEYNLLDNNGMYKLAFYKNLAVQCNGDIQKCKDIINIVFPQSYFNNPDGWTLKNQNEDVRTIFGKFIVNAIVFCSRFEDAIQLYELYIQALGEDVKDKPKVLSMSMRKGTPAEFQNMVNYSDVKKLFIEDNGDYYDNTFDSYSKKILINIIMEKAPSYSDAIHYVNYIAKDQIDSYALLHVLNKFKTKNENETFMHAYEVINHPKLRQFRTEVQMLNILYNIANDKNQEEYIDRLVEEDGKQVYYKLNRPFLSVKMLKEYRTLEDALDLYTQFYDNLKKDADKDNDNDRYANLFSTIVKKWKLAKKNNQVSDEELNRIKDVLIGESQKKFYDKNFYYVIALINLGVLSLFNENNEFTADFEKYLQYFTTTKSWNVLTSIYWDGNGDELRKKVCEKYVETRVKSKFSRDLNPDKRMKQKLEMYGIKCGDFVDNLEALEYEDTLEIDETNEMDEQDDASNIKDMGGNTQINFLEMFQEVSDENNEQNTTIEFSSKFKEIFVKTIPSVVWFNRNIRVLNTTHLYASKLRPKICDLLFNAYLKLREDNPGLSSLNPDWMMYKYAYDFSERHKMALPFEFDILKYLQTQAVEGLLTTSSIADITNHLLELSKRAQFNNVDHIVAIVNNDYIWRLMDYRAKVNCYVFFVKNNHSKQQMPERLKEITQKYEKVVKPLGALAIEKQTMRDNLLRSRWFFYLSLQYYFDIYKTIDTIIKIDKVKMSTLNHISLAYQFDSDFKEYLDNITNDNALCSIRSQIVEKNYIGATDEETCCIFTLYEDYIVKDMLLRYASLYYPEKLKISVDLRQKLEDHHEELTYSEIIEVLEVFQNVYEEAKEFYNKGKECNIFARKFAKEYKKKEANECNEQAVDYYYQSADLGNRDAMFKLSECYEKGYGVDKDVKLAYEWLEAAAKAGHKGAMKKLKDY